jgi:hypothetical protein
MYLLKHRGKNKTEESEVLIQHYLSLGTKLRQWGEIDSYRQFIRFVLWVERFPVNPDEYDSCFVWLDLLGFLCGAINTAGLPWIKP